ncbi:MAG: hypothetical protein ACW981_03485 [Candidatus Hodarchaeales archaeon]|jgi:hypothetical protein
MQTGSDTLGLLLSFLPPVGLILAVVLVYLRGKSRNRRIMDRIVNQILDEDFIDSISVVNETVTGRTYLAKLVKPKSPDDPIGNIQRIRIHFSMEERQMLFSWLFLLFKKGKDFVVFEGDPVPQKNDYMNVEIVRFSDLGKHQLEKLNEEFTEDYHDFEPNSEFGQKFIHKTNHPNSLKYLYSKDNYVKKIVYNLPGLHRISVKRKEEYTFRLVIQITKEFDMKLVKHLTTRFLKSLNEANQAILKQPKRFLKS